MKFELFSELYDQAVEYSDSDLYIADRGWQEWMNCYSSDSDVERISSILLDVFDLAHMDIKGMRANLNLTFKAFSSLYSIPSRTVQDWEYGKNKTPEYIKKLIAYTIFERRCHDEQN